MAWISGEAPAMALPPVLQPIPETTSWSQVSNLVPDLVGNDFGCPRKWGFEKRLGLRQTFGPMLDCGVAVDSAVTAHYFALMRGDSVQDASELAMQALSRDVKERGIPDDYVRMAVQGYRLIIEHDPEPPAAVQAEHSITVEGCRRLIGYSDKVTAAGMIADVKLSGSSRKDDETWIAEKRRQVSFYWVARVAAQRRGEGDGIPAPVTPHARLEVVVGTTRSKSMQLQVIELRPFDDDDLRFALRAIVASDRVARGGVYAPRPGRACGMCGFVEMCRSLGANEQPWSAVTGVPEGEE